MQEQRWPRINRRDLLEIVLNASIWIASYIVLRLLHLVCFEFGWVKSAGATSWVDAAGWTVTGLIVGEIDWSFLRGKFNPLTSRPICWFCDKTQYDVARLISNPSGYLPHVYICDECVDVCRTILEDLRQSATTRQNENGPGKSTTKRCSFCHRRQIRVEHLVPSSIRPAHICSGCIGICCTILDEELSSEKPAGDLTAALRNG